MDRGAWPCFVDGVTCLVHSVSVCEEKKKREDEREEKREDLWRVAPVCLPVLAPCPLLRLWL